MVTPRVARSIYLVELYRVMVRLPPLIGRSRGDAHSWLVRVFFMYANGQLQVGVALTMLFIRLLGVPSNDHYHVVVGSLVVPKVGRAASIVKVSDRGLQRVLRTRRSPIVTRCNGQGV